MYKIAICEDDSKYIEYLKKIILSTKLVTQSELLFYGFCSGEQLFLHPEFDFDVVILDMQMDKMDGYETAMNLRMADKKFLLVFCSGVVKPTSTSFKANPFRYLLKSFSDEEMISEMAEIVEEMKARKNYPYVMCKYTSGKDQIRVYPESILYIAIRHESCEVFAFGKLKESYPNEVLRVSMSLNELEKIFDEKCGFVRAHNSYIINMSYIVHTSRHTVRLIDGTELTISRSRSKEFQRAFAKFVSAKYKG